MRRGQWGLREQTEIVDNVDKSVRNSIFPKKGKKRVCKTYPQNWGQNVDNVDNKKVEHIFCATCLVYHKVGGLAEEKTFYLDRQGGGFTAGTLNEIEAGWHLEKFQKLLDLREPVTGGLAE